VIHMANDNDPDIVEMAKKAKELYEGAKELYDGSSISTDGDGDSEVIIKTNKTLQIPEVHVREGYGQFLAELSVDSELELTVTKVEDGAKITANGESVVADFGREVDVENVDAEVNNGTLKVEMPFVEQHNEVIDMSEFKSDDPDSIGDVDSTDSIGDTDDTED